jgi:hypothetical protein
MATHRAAVVSNSPAAVGQWGVRPTGRGDRGRDRGRPPRPLLARLRRTLPAQMQEKQGRKRSQHEGGPAHWRHEGARGSLSLHGGDRHLADWHRVFVGASTSATRRHDANVGQPASDRDAGCYHSRAQQEWPRHRCVQTPIPGARGEGDTAVADRCDAERERPGDCRLAIRVKVESGSCRRPQQEARQ